MQRALLFDSSPQLNVPLRFFITSPIFVLLAGFFLLWYGPDALNSRWGGSTLALVHLFTLGALANVMCGAMLQILPVATGVTILATRLTAWIVHICLTVGTIALCAGFVTLIPVTFHIASLFLTIGIIWFVIAVLGGFWKHRKNTTKGAPTIIFAVRLAVISLFITVILGLALAGSIAAYNPLPRHLTDLHANWGLFGWVGMLIVGISFQVIPMFQVTELFPKFITRWIALVIFITLVFFSVNVFSDHLIKNELAILLASATLFAYLVYGAVTFDLLRMRKRPLADTTTIFWRTSLASLGLCLPFWIAHIAGVADFSVVLGVLFIVGFAWSAVNGMIYKIIPFLLWYNTQRHLKVALRVVPKVKHFIPDETARPQSYAHIAALILLILASINPSLFTHIAAVALIISVAWLLRNISQSLVLFNKAKYEIIAELAKLEQD